MRMYGVTDTHVTVVMSIIFVLFVGSILALVLLVDPSSKKSMPITHASSTVTPCVDSDDDLAVFIPLAAAAMLAIIDD